MDESKWKYQKTKSSLTKVLLYRCVTYRLPACKWSHYKITSYSDSIVILFNNMQAHLSSYNNNNIINNSNLTIIRAAFVCLCVFSLSPPRSFDGSSPNLVGVCRWTSHLPLGSFLKRSTGPRVNGSLSLSTILYRRQPHATQLQRRLLLCCYCCRV